ncbi:MAG: hypothetical protein Q7W54_07285 [Bacteroidota bacterium]|nr:hypothetical protein [Bacteroidota bacterium]
MAKADLCFYNHHCEWAFMNGFKPQLISFNAPNQFPPALAGGKETQKRIGFSRNHAGILLAAAFLRQRFIN